jgi:hypothetical protein
MKRGEERGKFDENATMNRMSVCGGNLDAIFLLDVCATLLLAQRYDFEKVGSNNIMSRPNNAE